MYMNPFLAKKKIFLFSSDRKLYDLNTLRDIQVITIYEKYLLSAVKAH